MRRLVYGLCFIAECLGVALAVYALIAVMALIGALIDPTILPRP